MWQESGSETGGIKRGKSIVSCENEIVRKVEKNSDGFGFDSEVLTGERVFT